MNMLPIFPLDTVLFPGCRLPLQIFEQRYLEMVKTCLKEDTGFAVVLISKGREVGAAPEIVSIGCLARIVDWYQLENGLLGITVEGTARVSIGKAQVQDDSLMMAEVEVLEEQTVADHERLDSLVQLLKTLEQHPAVQHLGLNVDYRDLNSVLGCLCGLLPFSNSEKQYLLELNDMDMRLAAFTKLLKVLEGSS